jgi:hypothetical protein
MPNDAYPKRRKREGPRLSMLDAAVASFGIMFGVASFGIGAVQHWRRLSGYIRSLDVEPLETVRRSVELPGSMIRQ